MSRHAIVTIVLATLTTLACGVSESPRPRPAEPGAETGTGASNPSQPDPETKPTPSAPNGSGGGAGGNTGGTGGSPAAGNQPPGPGASADGAAPPTMSPTTNPMPPASGVMVSINGMMVPKEKVIVLLHLGHSNMAGRASSPADLRPHFYQAHPQLWRYQKGGVWKPAVEPLSGDGGSSMYAQGAGPGMALLRAALTAAPDAHIVSIGRGASLDFSASCFSFRKGGLFYDFVMGPALELKGKVTFGGLFVMLGYDGRTNPRAKSPGFIDCLKGLAADYRADLGEPELPYVESEYEQGASGTWSPSCCGAPQVIAQIAQVPEAIPRALLIPTDGIPMQDNHHFNLAGHKLWAERAFMLMKDKGFVPWASAP